MKKEIVLPKLGESILSATILKWYKKEKDFIQKDEMLLKVATDKTVTEIPAIESGILEKILKQEKEEVQIGEKIAIISTESKDKEFKDEKSFLSPSVKRLLKEHNISKKEIESFFPGRRISKKEIEDFLNKKNFIEMDFIRKTISKNMTLGHSIPSASIFFEVDVTDLLDFIEKKKKDFLSETNTKLTITAFIIKAVALACRSFNLINSTLKDNSIFLKEQINLGVAIDTKTGLFVPNIKNADKESIKTICKFLQEFKNKAKDGSFIKEDLEKGTLTLTNFGMGGAFLGIPIIKYPEAAIIGVGKIDQKVFLDNENKCSLRKVVIISLTFDHRIIDGMYGCSFLKEVKKILESGILYDK